jgi:hypothetical protein
VADPLLHLRLQEYGLTRGCKVSITATRGPDRRRQWVVTQAIPEHLSQAPTPPTPAAKVTVLPTREPATATSSAASVPATGDGKPTTKPDNGQPRTPSAPANGHPKPGANGHHRPPPVDLASLTRLMSQCLSSASQAWATVEHVQYAPADIRAVGITLFLECSRRGVAPEELVLGPAFVEKVLGSGNDDLPF